MENGPDDADPELQNDSTHNLYLRSPFGERERNDYFTKGYLLYKAVSNGKWEQVERILNNDRDAVRAYITEGLETPLHIAALTNHVKFVKKLVEHMRPQDLAITNAKGNTALCLAAANWNVDIAEVLIGLNPALGNFHNDGGISPIMMAAKLGNREMVKKLLNSNCILTPGEKAELLKELIASDLFDIAQEMIEADQDQELEVPDITILQILVTKPMAEGSRIFFCFGKMKQADSPQVGALKLLKHTLKRVFAENYSNNIRNIVEIAPNLLFDAAKQGNFHFFKWLIYYYPELVWKTNIDGVSMFHLAVQHGHASIFALLHNMDEVRKLVTLYEDNAGNNMLHLAATSAPKDINGAAFQMQHAICWYKAVEKIVPPAYRDKKNEAGKTPANIFDEEHRPLLEAGEKWMKGTAKSCMVVAALTATVMYSSAFTVPGGYDNKGHSYLLNKPYFQLLTVSEVIGMLFSSTSILLFLSILTSRFNKKAFQRALPCKLMLGVATLFFSIAFMLLAFCTTIYLSYGNTSFHGLIFLLAGVPLMFICLEARLLFDIVKSTFASCFNFRSSYLPNH